MNEVTKVVPKGLAKPGAPEALTPINWIRHEIDRLFEDFGRPAFSFLNPASAAVPAPALEFTDGKDGYRLSAELPGLAQDDVEISVADGVLTITGDKKEEKEHKENGYLISERSYGSFRRDVALPTDADAAKITARFKHGVLDVTIGKQADAPPRARKIAIDK